MAYKITHPLFCSFLAVLAEDAIKAALNDYKIKREKAEATSG